VCRSSSDDGRLRRWPQVANTATKSTTYLLVVLVVAATCRLRVAVASSMAAMLALNFFFLPPVGKFTIADPQNRVALFAFLAVSPIASNLSAVARARTHEAVGRRDELLSLLARNHDRVLTHRAILKAVWGASAVEQPEHLWTLVAQLRKKIEPDPATPKYLVSEPWVGYRFVAE
jgi:K+-sensing histidine kinase KdpD